ncbi:MAG TPA: hypothetical protein PLW81_06115 [Thiobacillaceae bacterium]|nr:hypothetical protein [Thiobacillaceae bacterium]
MPAAAPMTRHGLTWLEQRLGLAEVVHTQYRDPGSIAHPWRPINLWRPAWCNCLIWAASQQRRHGGYVLKRRLMVPWRWHPWGKTRPAFWPHALWSPDGETCYEYTTGKPSALYAWQLPAMLLFRGRVELVTRQWP